MMSLDRKYKIIIFGLCSKGYSLVVDDIFIGSDEKYKAKKKY
jgi:hypothetical protein